MAEKDYKTLKDFIGVPIASICDYDGFFYIKPEDEVDGPNMWRVNKDTGNVEFYDAFMFMMELNKKGLKLSDLPSNDQKVEEEFKQFLLSFSS